MLLISLTPGAGAVNSMAMGLDHGVRRALWTVAGQQAALIVQLLVVATGVGALVTRSPVAFEVVRWSGVAYLVYLGISKFLAKPVTLDEAEHVSARVPGFRLMTRGFVVNMLNPKAIVFMLAITPQLLNYSRPMVPQWLIIGATMIIVDVAVMTGYATLATRLRRFFRDAAGLRRLNRVFGVLFCLTAVLLALG